MLMSGDRSPINVSAIRAQLEQQLLHHNRSAATLPKRRSRSTVSNIEDGSLHTSPPVPRHSLAETATDANASSPGRLVLPEIPARVASREIGKKPPLYPKPKFLEPKSTSTMPEEISSPATNGQCTPVITVSSTSENLNDSLPPCLSDSVLRRAQMFEDNGTIPISPSYSANDSARPDSTVSTFSNSSCHKDFSDSESEDERRPEHLGTNLDLEHLSPNKFNTRRTSSFGQNHDSVMHEKIMSELKRQGVVRSSSHQPLFKKRVETHTHRTKIGKSDGISSPPSEIIPSDVGKLRTDLKKKNDADDTEFPSSNSDESHSRGDSMISDRNSTLTTLSDNDGVIEYCTGDPEEDNRLKKLHYAANEFYSMQMAFVKYLRDVGEIYPKYVQEYGNRIGKDLLAIPPGHSVHPVLQLSQEFSQIINVHKIFLGAFTTLHSNWNSLNPSLSDVILKLADFLKICKQFLLEKSRFVQDISKLQEENKEFEAATVSFEQKIFGRGVGAIVQQLDQVHQNFMRYKLLMLAYRRHLIEDSEEWKKAGEAIDKLENITRSVNEAMGYATNEELYKLYIRFQCQFDVFYQGRRLIRQGEVMKQTRKEPQPRYLILFSDVLWICRVYSGIIGSGDFDMAKSYRIPIDGVRLDFNDHEDYEKILTVRSKQRSVILIFPSVKERNIWHSDISNAKRDVKLFKRRMSEAIEKQRRQSTAPLPVLSPVPGLVDESESIASTGEQSLSRSQSIDTTSQPTTPVSDLPNPIAPEWPSSMGVGKNRVKCSEVDKPVWLPDDSSTKCLMENCDTSFSLLNRRHHCRDCGWLICTKCCGRAPLSKYEYKKEIVCPECFDKIVTKYKDGTLFPKRLLSKTSEGSLRVKVRKGQNNGYASVEPQSLFVSPVNKGLKRLNVDKRFKGEEGDVFSKVYIKSPKNGNDILRYALLRDGCTLQFFKAPLDEKPCESYVIYGFTLTEQPLDNGGTLFELVHRNQIQTDRRENIIAFRVEHQKSIEKWSTALNKAL